MPIERTPRVDRHFLQDPEDLATMDDEAALAATAAFYDEQDSDEDIDVEIFEEEDGSATVSFGPEEEDLGAPAQWFDDLGPFLSDQTLSELASAVCEQVESDRQSRAEWEETYAKGLRLLGLSYEERHEPFEGATGVVHPILNESVTQFQAGAYKEMLPPQGPVKAMPVGEHDPEVEKQAKRVEEYMNYQLMYAMEEYEPEFDQMLYYLGLNGSAFKKVYRDDMLGRPVSKFIPGEQVVVPYTATDLKTSVRVTHVIKMPANELRKAQVAGVYMDIDLGGAQEDSPGPVQEERDKIEGRTKVRIGGPEDDEYTLLECHCYLDLDEFPDLDMEGNPTGVQVPYIVTVCEDTHQVLSVRRNYAEEDPSKQKIQHFVHYKFTPGLGFYGYGLIHLLGNLSRTATANMRQLIDAGTFANMPSGFKARGVRVEGDDQPLHPGEWRDVDVPGGDLRNAIVPAPYKEPSATLFQLLGYVVETAQRFVGNTDLGIDSGNKEMPVGTTLALLERGARVISAVHKRLHAALKLELKMLAQLFGEDPAPYPYPVGADQQIKAQDFDARVDVLPVSDPNIFSMAQRVILAQEQLKLASQAPELHNMREAYRRMYSALGVTSVEALLKPEQVPHPKDPITENLEASAAASGQLQLKVYPQEDHETHIAVHQLYLKSATAKGQPQVLMTLEKHIHEHIAVWARTIVEKEMQQAGYQPPEQQPGTPDPEVEAYVAIKQVQLLEEYMEKYPPEQVGEDPLVDIKRQEVAIKAQDVEHDNQLDELQAVQDHALAQQQLAQADQHHDENMELQYDKLAVQRQAAAQRARAAQGSGGGNRGS